MFTEGALNYLIVPVVGEGLYALHENGQYVRDGHVTWAITQDTARKLATDIMNNLHTFPPTLSHYVDEFDDPAFGGTDE